ncbi:MAG: TonB-dependent receptor [Rubrivivax sp.]|nr:TonB-dependent receptor [Rubrivivax sp.]
MNRSTRSYRRHALAAAVALALSGAAQAQLSTATIKGQIAGGSAASQAGLIVTAVNKANGATYRTMTRADGSYVLTGLAPGAYDIRVALSGGATPSQEITLAVGETAAVDLGVSVDQRITIVGSAQRQGVRTSEVGTNVSRRMIEALPQTSRNFLSSIDLAPGVAFNTDANGYAKAQSGAQSADNLNVFIDGVGQKNNIVRGGISGGDSSRGNPFPQSAIAEYKVIGQNYKAEYDQVSSVAITAITRSGTNEYHGNAYIDRTGTNWRAKSAFEQEREAQGVMRPDSSKKEYGFSMGGPIVRDQIHFFFAYDGKIIDDSRQIVPQHLSDLPAGLGIVPTLAAAQGGQVDTFREHLLFGKVDAQIGNDHRLSFSVRTRRETDRVAESRDLSAPGNDRARSNKENRLDLKHEWTRGAWLSEARLGYEDYTFNPRSAASTPFVKYKVSTANPQLLNNSADVLFMGGSPDAQDKRQKGIFISEDLTYTGLSGHVMKGGVKIKNMKYNLSGTAFGVDTVETLVDRITGLPYYNGDLCTGTNVVNGGLNSDECRISRAIPGASANFSNTQFGMYFQDDWAINKKLELNLGVRWDIESNMLNNDYATPPDRVSALRALDVARYGITPPAGQTYAQSLAKGGIAIDDYISTGNSRKTYKGAIAPRLGASYDILGGRATVVYGGWGRSYDRTMANHALDELQKNQQAGGEIWLIRNKFKMPFADQFSLGVRQALGSWNADITLSRVQAKNQFIWFVGNRDANGGFATQLQYDPLWGGPSGFGNLLLGDFVGETKTDALLMKLEKPYTRSSGWAANFAYTHSSAKTIKYNWSDEIWDWTYGRPGVRGWNSSMLVAKNRLVAAGMADTLLPWGLTASAKLTWDDGMPRRITSCADGWDKCKFVKGESTNFTQLDVGVSKEFAFASQAVTLRADILNVFNKTNYGGFDDWGGGPGNPQNWVGGDNPNLGKPNSIRGDTRTYRLVLGYKF